MNQIVWNIVLTSVAGLRVQNSDNPGTWPDLIGFLSPSRYCFVYLSVNCEHLNLFSDTWAISNWLTFVRVLFLRCLSPFLSLSLTLPHFFFYLKTPVHHLVLHIISTSPQTELSISSFTLRPMEYILYYGIILRYFRLFTHLSNWLDHKIINTSLIHHVRSS